ncbi:MAG: PEP-CTERM sorting domain-containing protein [Phycisphaera sp.]|nr:PEP-CTERM sorting domain-containing protein [Phycisphaera sp.]
MFDRTPCRILAGVVALGLSSTVASAALVNTAFTYSDMTLETSAAWSNGGGNLIGFSRLNQGNTATFQSALTTVTDFTAGTNFTVTGSFAVTTSADGTSSSTTNRLSSWGVTLFGNTSDPTVGVFASLVVYENRPNYNGGQRLGLGTNRPSAGGSYIGNYPESGAAESGETFLTGSNTLLANGDTPTYTWTIAVSYDSPTQVDIAYTLTDGTNTNTLTANNVDITAVASNKVFGVTASERNRSLAGTFSAVTVNQAVPEPASFVALGMVLLLVSSRRRREL